MALILRTLLRLAALAAIGGAVAAVAARRRGDVGARPEPVWPAVDSARTGTSAPPAEATTSWAAPCDGGCPETHPIKAKAASGIYHRPGGRFYDRTVPDRCYGAEADAEADGYRAARS